MLETRVNRSRVLIDNFLNILSGHLNREWVAFDCNVDGAIQIVIFKYFCGLLLRNIDTRSSLLRDRLNRCALLAYNLAANRRGNGYLQILLS